MMRHLRNYTELSQLKTFEERYRYLQLRGKVGEDTFGFDRWINQLFYHDKEWLSVRDMVIIRDKGCDLGMLDREIKGDVKIIIHHMNPITKEDILRRSEILLNPEYLICCLDSTHKAIHYGDENLLIQMPRERRPFDTCPWRM